MPPKRKQTPPSPDARGDENAPGSADGPEGPPPDANHPLIVGIGASAGGLEALRRFFKAMPDAIEEIAFVVIVHLSPDHESSLAQLLQIETRLPVTQVNDRVRIETRHVYVIPPSKALSITDGHLSLANFEQPPGRRAPIDLFFRSLASVGDNGVAIVLTGGNADGSVGLRAVKEEGGLVMVQDPLDAAHESMPRAAIATGLADFILPCEQLAQKVAAYVSNRRQIRLAQDPEEVSPEDGSFLLKILARLRSQSGHDFSNYKQSTVLRRVARRMQMHQVDSLAKYLDFLRSHPEEALALLKNLLISVTRFFRDADAWDAIAEKIIPRLVHEHSEGKKLRLWIAGCATGEEAYSFVMLILEQMAHLPSPPEIQIFATDLDEEALAKARHGLYPAAICADVSEERLRRFFSKEGDNYRVKKEVRERVLFAVHNVLRDPPFSKLDLISCRNLLIYLNRNAQDDLFQIFHYALWPNAYLFLGSAESIDGARSLFRDVSKKHRIFRRSETGATRLPQMEAGGAPGRGEAVSALRADLNLPSDADRHSRMLELQAPPSVLITRGFELLHLSGSAGRYLQRPGGRPSNDVLREIRPELRLDLQMALQLAFEEGRSVSTRPVSVPISGEAAWVHIIVIPGEETEGTGEQALVLFAEVESTGHSGQDSPETAAGQEADSLRSMSEEVQRLKERLQTALEEYRLSNEGMRASNEELQSISEEYRSTTEELETSKEELQSVNEELETLNLELKAKLEELGRTNSDLQNFMSSTEIATLFLDRDLCVKRFTPRVSELFNLRDIDLGRPIAHLTPMINYHTLVEDAGRALHELTMVERRVSGPGDAWFLTRLRPYRTVDHHIEGVVLTFIDITDIKKAEEEIRLAKEYSEAIVDTVQEGLLVLDRDLKILSANPWYFQLFHQTSEETVGRSIFEAGEGQWDQSEVRDHLGGTLTARNTRTVQVESTVGNLGPRTVQIRARPIETQELILVALEDVTERHRAQQMLEELNRTLEKRVREGTQEIRRLASELTLAEHAERRRISTILHDDLQQRLVGIDLRLSVALQNARSGRQDQTVDPLAQSVDLIQDAIRISKTLAVELSPPVLDAEGLRGALMWLREEMNELFHFQVEVRAGNAHDLPDHDVRVLLFRIVRELIFNVIKHAGVDRAVVELGEDAEGLIIRVSDEGTGFDPGSIAPHRQVTSGLGLSSIRHRMSLLGGRTQIESTPGRGTQITLRVPRQDSPA